MSAVNVIGDLAGKAFTVFLTLLLFAASGTEARAVNGTPGHAEVKVVAVLSTDELGENFRYPSALAYDEDMDEIYVVAGGKSKVIVFNSGFFPIVSLGPGRGAIAAGGVYVHDDGRIYLCQGETETSPGRITVFNPAFFPENEITFEDLPGGEKFIPRDMIIGLTGNYYIVGQNNRGVLVLDSEGEFSHWLQPMDQIFDLEAVEAAREEIEEEELELTEKGRQALEDETGSDAADMTEFLPQELIPGSVASRLEERKTGLGPVKVVDVERDTEGHLYVLSEETGKVYVYSPFEEFLFSFGEKGGSSGKLSRPRNLVVDERKKAVFIVDYMRHSILIYDLGGKFMYEFGGLGTGPGWFQYPTGLELNRDGLLVVSDLFNHRVQVLDVRFEYKFPLFQSPGSVPGIREDLDTGLPEFPETDEDDGGDILQPQPL
jgi:DNA-binding beta-propeller fold protein YncE